jgi:hypothetical protein
LPFWTELEVVLGLVLGLVLGFVLGLVVLEVVLEVVLGLVVLVLGLVLVLVLGLEVEFVLGLGVEFVLGLGLGLVLVLLFFYVADYINYCRIRLNLNLDPIDCISLIIEDYVSSLNIQMLYPSIDNLSSWQKRVNKFGIAWYLFPDIYEAASKNKELLEQVNLTVAECQELNSQYSIKREQAFRHFIASVLLEERRSGNIPAWEGIRIVRERI